MHDYRVEAQVSKDGSVTVKDLPFQAGDRVEVIIRARTCAGEKEQRYPLRGKPVRYTDPFGSVAEDDWEALRLSFSTLISGCCLYAGFKPK